MKNFKFQNFLKQKIQEYFNHRDYLYIYKASAFHELFEYACRDLKNFRRFLGTWDIRKYISKNDFVRAVDAFASEIN